MVKPGGGIDLDRYFVVCANVLGGCMGTTGPSSVDPGTGEPWGSRFPEITVADIVDVQFLLMRQLGFGHVHAVVGGSFGGMQALCFAVRHPGFADKVAVIASAPRSPRRRSRSTSSAATRSSRTRPSTAATSTAARAPTPASRRRASWRTSPTSPAR